MKGQLDKKRLFNVFYNDCLNMQHTKLEASFLASCVACERALACLSSISVALRNDGAGSPHIQTALVVLGAFFHQDTWGSPRAAEQLSVIPSASVTGARPSSGFPLFSDVTPKSLPCSGV
jgi:hypothetical protein